MLPAKICVIEALDLLWADFKRLSSLPKPHFFSVLSGNTSLQVISLAVRWCFQPRTNSDLEWVGLQSFISAASRKLYRMREEKQNFRQIAVTTDICLLENHLTNHPGSCVPSSDFRKTGLHGHLQTSYIVFHVFRKLLYPCSCKIFRVKRRKNNWFTCTKGPFLVNIHNNQDVKYIRNFFLTSV